MSEISKNLGQSLEYLRKAKGVTQDQLARSAKLPRTTIAYMESGVGNPSLRTLHKVALALGVSYEELLSPPKPPCLLIRNQDLKRQKRAQGKVSKIDLLPGPLAGLQIERIELSNYSLLVGTPHSRGTHEYFTCIQGTISINVEGEDFELEKGDVLAFPGDRKHSYRNREGTESQGISIVILHGLVD